MTIVGQGLAGTCLAWHFWKRGVPFFLIDRENGGASRVAAGLINPVTGKNFEPSWRIGEFLPEALAFYAELEAVLGRQLWYPMTVLRIAGSEKEWAKISAKLGDEKVRPWIGKVSDGEVEVTGGGRLDVRTFVDASREFFRDSGIYAKGESEEHSHPVTKIFCEGAVGLMGGKYGPHRCAKGEILTIRAAWDESRVRVGGGGWLLPVGNGIFRAGATYEWDELDELPTDKGRDYVENIIRKLGGEDYQIIAHEAGIRPILRRSEPMIGPIGGGDWMFNGLGSKGSLYAPGAARRLAEWILDGREAEPELDFRVHAMNRPD